MVHSPCYSAPDGLRHQLYDLMTMGFKYQVLSCTVPSDLLKITVKHLNTLMSLFPSSAHDSAAYALINRTMQLVAKVSQQVSSRCLPADVKRSAYPGVRQPEGLGARCVTVPTGNVLPGPESQGIASSPRQPSGWESAPFRMSLYADVVSGIESNGCHHYQSCSPSIVAGRQRPTGHCQCV